MGEPVEKGAIRTPFGRRGAVAHPFGATGGWLMPKKGAWLEIMCIGHEMPSATIVEGIQN